MGLKVVPAGEQDAARSVAIESIAYGSDDVLFPRPFAENADMVRREQMIKDLHDDPACCWVKVVDEDLVAQGHDGMVSFSMAYVWDSTPRKPEATNWGPEANAEACDLLFGGMAERWAARMGNKPHLYLKLLHTDPAHQGRGAGSMILKHFADEADKLGLESYLEASEKGQPLYEKFGYETVEVFVVDLSKWDGPEKSENCLMVRKPTMGG